MLSAALLVSGAPVGGSQASAAAQPSGSVSAPATTSASVTTLQTEAAQLARQMVLEQLQIGGYQQQYAAAVERVEQDQALLATTGSRIAADQATVRRDDDQLTRAAVEDYVQDGGATSSAEALFDGQSTTATRSVYEQVMSGDLTTAVEDVRTAKEALTVQRAAQTSLVAEDQATQAQAARLLSQAQATEQELATQQASVTGQLAAAVAAQQAQQAEEAAAALAAARQASATSSTSTDGSSAASSSSGASAAAGGTSGAAPSLPPFLVCVVQAESGGDYQAVSPTGQYMGAFQFSQSTWNYAAQLAGMPGLIGVAPDTAPVADQDALAIALYAADGEQPWYDPCRSG